MTARDYIRANMAKMRNNAAEFHKTFGVSLGRFMHPLTGFDVVRFDKHFAPPDGQSLEEAVKEHHGQKAVELILTLIGYKKSEKNEKSI